MEHAHPAVHVPARLVAPGVHVLRTGRLPDGTRTGIAFSSADAAHRVMGPDHAVLELSLDALRSMLAPTGVEHVQLDPDLVAAPVGRVA